MTQQLCNCFFLIALGLVTNVLRICQVDTSVFRIFFNTYNVTSLNFILLLGKFLFIRILFCSFIFSWSWISCSKFYSIRGHIAFACLIKTMFKGLIFIILCSHSRVNLSPPFDTSINTTVIFCILCSSTVLDLDIVLQVTLIRVLLCSFS